MKKFNDANILIVHSSDYTRRILNAILKVIGVGSIKLTYEATDSFEECFNEHYSVIIAEISNGMNDGIALTKRLRHDKKNKNNHTPVLAITNPHAMHLIEDAREAGISDLLQAPYSPDNIAERILFALNIETPVPVDKPKGIHSNALTSHTWPTQKESEQLTDMLMDHYLRHHEIVLTKLRFAQEATKISLNEIKNLHQSIKDNSEQNLKDFDSVWERIITMFLKGGLSEQALFDIEKIVTQIPEDIKQHYNALTQKDQEFLLRIEKLNKMSYERAKNRVLNLQKLPNPLTGKTAIEYKSETQKLLPHIPEEPIKTFFYDSVSEKTVMKKSDEIE